MTQLLQGMGDEPETPLPRHPVLSGCPGGIEALTRTSPPAWRVGVPLKNTPEVIPGKITAHYTIGSHS